MIPGNHDFLFERESEKARSIIEECGDIHLLIDQGIEIESLKIWGIPNNTLVLGLGFQSNQKHFKWYQSRR